MYTALIQMTYLMRSQPLMRGGTMSKSEMAHHLAERLGMAVLAGAASLFSRSDHISVFCMAVMGAAFGSVVSSFLSGTITAPGLEKLDAWRRYLLHCVIGSATGYFGSWKVQSSWMPESPTEFVAALLGFVAGIVGVVLLLNVIPWALDMLKAWMRARKPERRRRKLP